MAFAPIKLGGWADEDPVTGDQISQIQEYLLKCPNFLDGGIYSPSGQIDIRGGGVRIETLSLYLGNLDSSSGYITESFTHDRGNGDFLYANRDRRCRISGMPADIIVYLKNSLYQMTGSIKDGSVIEVTNASVDYDIHIRKEGSSDNLFTIAKSTLSPARSNWVEFVYHSYQSGWFANRWSTET